MLPAERYCSLVEIAKKEELGCDYIAAFYLLSLDDDVFNVSRSFVSSSGIDFTKIKKNSENFEERLRFLIDIAHNLFSYSSDCEATPFEISRLGYPLLEQVCNALYISTSKMLLSVVLDEHGHQQFSLDNSPYLRTKKTYEMLTNLGDFLI